MVEGGCQNENDDKLPQEQEGIAQNYGKICAVLVNTNRY